MFDIKPEDINGLPITTNKLLYNIWHELVSLRQSREGTGASEAMKELKSITCKKCGDVFDNKGKFLAHTRTHKKVGK